MFGSVPKFTGALAEPAFVPVGGVTVTAGVGAVVVDVLVEG